MVKERQGQVLASLEVLSKSQEGDFPRVFSLWGSAFLLLKEVFSPFHFDSTRIFGGLLNIQSGDTVLEVGPGCGALTTMMALSGATLVDAVDVNPAAVENTRLNAALHHMSNVVSAWVGDALDAVPSERQYDVVFWNTPFIYRTASYRCKNALEFSLFDPGYASHRRFFAQVGSTLSDKGKILLGFGDFGELELLYSIAEANGFAGEIVGSGKGSEGGAVEFQLIEFGWR